MNRPADPRVMTLVECREAARTVGVQVQVWAEQHRDGMVWRKKTVGQSLDAPGSVGTGWLLKVAKSDDARMMQVVRDNGFPWELRFIAIDELHQCLYYALMPDELEKQWDTPSAEEKGV